MQYRDQLFPRARRLLTALTEHEIADRARRRLQRHLREAQLPRGKTPAALGRPEFAMKAAISKLDKYHLKGNVPLSG